MDPWTPDEDARLRSTYPAGGLALAMAEIPGRSESSIFHRARRLGLNRRRRWTPGDDLTLEALWGEGLRLSAIAKTLQRTQATVYWRAQKLGLPLGCPEGFEYLSHAAERAGFSTGRLVQILRSHGFKVRAALARPRGVETRRFHVVAPEDVDAAVAAYVQTETPQEAARRRGINADRLRARLARIGIANEPGERKRMRVTDAQVEAANELAVWSHRNRVASGASSHGGGG
jgi:hypothetical protein